MLYFGAAETVSSSGVTVCFSSSGFPSIQIVKEGLTVSSFTAA